MKKRKQPGRSAKIAKPVKGLKNSQAIRRLGSLTEREKTVFHYLSLGFQSKDISEKIKISYRTVETHIGKIYSKLKFTSQYDLMHFCVKNNLVERKNDGKLTTGGKLFLNKLNESETKLISIALKNAGTDHLSKRLKLTNKTVEFYIRRMCLYSKTSNRNGLLRFVVVNNVDKSLN